MNLLTAADGALIIDTEVKTAVVVHRKFRDKPDGVNDREVEIWHNNNWVPAYFSDIKKDDFYLIDPLRHMHKEDQCFYAAANCVTTQSRGWDGTKIGPKSFVIPRGAQIVQAPKQPERTLNELSYKADDHRSKIDDRGSDVHPLAIGHRNRL